MKRKGTTLIEVILYTVIAGIFVTTITMFAWNAISTKNRNDAQTIVNDSAQIAIEEMEKSVRNASSIVTPLTKGTTSNSLSLNYPDGSNKTFSLDSGRIKLTSPGATYYITPVDAVIDEMTFLNLTRSGSLGIIQIHLKMSRKNPANVSELSASSEINVSETLRN